MLLYNNLIEILKILPKNMPVFLESVGHYIYPIYFNLEVHQNGEDTVFLIRDNQRTLLDYIIEDPDKELITDDDMENSNYSSKQDCLRDWVSCYLITDRQVSVYKSTIYSSREEKVNLVVGYNYDGPRAFTVKEIVNNDRIQAHHKQLPITFKHEVDFRPFMSTAFVGIGINKLSFMFKGIRYERGTAVILSTNFERKDPEKDICDFSLYRNNHKRPRPKKYSLDLYHCLISERRKTHEKD